MTDDMDDKDFGPKRRAVAAAVKKVVERECRKQGGIPVDVALDGMMLAACDLIEEYVGTDKGKNLVVSKCRLLLTHAL